MSIESLETMRKRLIFRSWHRGTKELDLILGPFANTFVPEFSEADLNAYEKLLHCNDPEVYGWLTGKGEPEERDLSSMVSKIGSFVTERHAAS